MDTFQRVLLGLIVLRWLVDALFLLNILPLEHRDPTYRWYLHHGGDQDLMFELARSLLSGLPVRSVIGIGQALVMALGIILFDPFYYIELACPLVVVNGFFFGGLSVWVVGQIAQSSLKNKRLALWSAGVWAILPVIGYVAFFWHFDWLEVVSATVPTLAWLNGLSDGPAVFFMLLATLLLLQAAGSDEPPGFWRSVGVGASLSAAVMFRIHIVSMVICLLIYVWVVHGWRIMLAVTGGALLTYLPQAWYNQLVFGLPFTSGYISYGDVLIYGGTFRRPLSDFIPSMPFHPRHIADNIVQVMDGHLWLALPAVVGLGLGVVMLVLIKRRFGGRVLTLLIIAPIVYIVPMLTAWNFRDDIIRFSMLLILPTIIVGLYAIEILLSFIKQRLLSSR